MDSSILKIIAMLSMLIDHIGAVLFKSNINFRIIGRLAFPIFAFQLVEGYFHTTNKIKYLQRMVVFALVTEPFFDLAFFNRLEFSHQNVLFTFVIGIVMINLLEKYNFGATVKTYLFQLIFVAIFCFIAILIKCDYDFLGVITIYYFYLYRKGSLNKLSITLFLIVIYSIANYQIIIFGFSIPLEVLAVFSLIFIFSYNGKKGALNKWVGYLFYPGHLALLYIIAMFFNF